MHSAHNHWEYNATVAVHLSHCGHRSSKQRFVVCGDTEPARPSVGIALHGDFGVILDDGTTAPSDVLKGLNEEIKKGANNSDFARTQSGSDGIRTRDLHLDRVAC